MGSDGSAEWVPTHRLRRKGGFAPTLRLAKLASFVTGIAFLPISQSFADEPKVLRPVFYVKDEELAKFATAVAYLYSMNDLEAFFEQNADRANFVFVSIPGLIQSRKVNTKLLDMFSEGVRNDISKHDSDSDECFVQEFTTNIGRKFVLALNEPDNGPLDIDRKCVLLALSFFDSFSYATPEAFDTNSIPELTLSVLSRLNSSTETDSP
jgi:hypothetical protein